MTSTPKKKIRPGTQSYIEAIQFHNLQDTHTYQVSSEEHMTRVCVCVKLYGLKGSRIDYIFTGPIFHGKVDNPELKVHTFTDHKSMTVEIVLVPAKFDDQVLVQPGCSRCVMRKRTCSII
ncbi:hypothetical protein DSO57_1019896 [Entomophthora muscae]|uniref:Uncharacterized protein n=1 Tax=Entomophthora muscae TaxID=34485 RepID=A0ACC2TF80_9FUNG|nr:hypothetical protein DSO57_1019896 [Entomophthora muscae]